MLLELSDENLALSDRVQLSYFVKNRARKALRVAHARLIDISEAGLCMEISPLDSDLFLESRGKLSILSKQVELQIFCRSHPINVSVTGHIKWFKRKEEDGVADESGNVYAGVIFPFADFSEKREIVDLVRHLKNNNVRCSECGTRISAEAAICYRCGRRPVRRRTILRKAIFGLLARGEHDS